MTISQFIVALEQALHQHGDLPIRISAGDGSELLPADIRFAKRGDSFHHGKITGAPQFEPDRLLIKSTRSH